MYSYLPTCLPSTYLLTFYLPAYLLPTCLPSTYLPTTPPSPPLRDMDTLLVAYPYRENLRNPQVTGLASAIS
jgi:hypothetical protein